MPIAKHEALTRLVASMSKAEKRHFSLYASRLESNTEALFLRLFQKIETGRYTTEPHLLKALGEINKTQFINAKRNLYTQLLRSLRVLRDRTDKTFEQRQKVDYALLLYQRGLISESLILLDQAKKSMQESDRRWLYQEALELQKLIESRHITRSRQKSQRIENLIERSKEHSNQVAIETQLTNVSLSVQGFYIKMGFAKNERDALLYKSFFDSHIPRPAIADVSPFSMMLWCQCKVWENLALLKWQFTYKYALQWVEIGQQLPQKIQDVDLINRGYHYLLTACFYLGAAERFEEHYTAWDRFTAEHHQRYNPTSTLLDFIYKSNAQLNKTILLNTPKLKELTLFTSNLEQRWADLDQHRALVFVFKLAMIESYRGNYEAAIVHLNRILETQQEPLRADVFNYARLILLLCHYKLTNFRLVTNLISSVKAAFESQDRLTVVVDTLLNFLRKGCRAMNFGINELIDSTHNKLVTCSRGQFDKVDFVYFDFISWVVSLKDGETIFEVRKRQ